MRARRIAGSRSAVWRLFARHGISFKKVCARRSKSEPSKADAVTVAAIEAGVPMLVEVRALIDSFHAMIRKKTEADLEPWIEAASPSLIASFANGIAKDTAAVHTAIKQPWSNGQTEGQITKLTLVKHQCMAEQSSITFSPRLIGIA